MNFPFAAYALLLLSWLIPLHAGTSDVVRTYYKDYRPPAFTIPSIDLTLDVQESKVIVTSRLEVFRNAATQILRLDGKNHEIASVSINGQLLDQANYQATANELVLFNVPSDPSFRVTIVSAIDPFHNLEREGLYASGKALISQCESEGARRIFYTLDRPDVLSRIATTIMADPKRYPYRLSNGNLIEETALDDGRKKIVWDDPIPKPSYLFACILGDFAKATGHYKTKSGRDVSLEVYGSLGKLARTAYSLEALKLAMRFDEEYFDREYDLNSLKMVAAPDFNMGAMENKGLLVFNEMALLVDKDSGTDANFRAVASTVAHEYFHNWSGNRVTVRNWFELALKEAFTDFRTMLFSEWLFGSALIRPKQVMALRENQFPEELSETGHPIIVESYVNARSIYDATTYIKGREVFRTLQTFMDQTVPDGFRKAQNLYFERYDGQAVTFRELLGSANDVLQAHTNTSLSQFERWFTQQGTPQITVSSTFFPERNEIELLIEQACPHPRTGQEQPPMLIPFSYELLRKDGRVAVAKQTLNLSEQEHRIVVASSEPLIPLFMQGYSAPVVLHYPYTFEELACLIKHVSDPFCQWEATQNYLLLALKEAGGRLEHQSEAKFDDLFEHLTTALANPTLPVLAKAYLLQLPSLRAIAQFTGNYDFRQLDRVRTLFRKQLAAACKPLLETLLKEHRPSQKFAPTSSQMQTRELRKCCWSFLVTAEESQFPKLIKEFRAADNFDTSLAMLQIAANQTNPLKQEVIEQFYQKWKGDKSVFNHWLSAQAGSTTATVDTLKGLMQVEGFDPVNPNHLRSVLSVFVDNLARFHDADGKGYAFIVDQILEIERFNSHLSHNDLTVSAFLDYERLPVAQRELMSREMKRLLEHTTLPETKDLMQTMLQL